jgi:hypothetical protein
MSDVKRDFLRHTLATLVYRGAKVLRDAPESFAALAVSGSTRKPLAILGHINDLLDWARSMADGSRQWQDATPASWTDETDRFFAAAKRFDDYLASDAPLASTCEQLFQGPIADALTHVGQLAMLRRIGGQPVRGENYFKADIAAGRVGREQSAPRREFD